MTSFHCSKRGLFFTNSLSARFMISTICSLRRNILIEYDPFLGIDDLLRGIAMKLENIQIKILSWYMLKNQHILFFKLCVCGINGTCNWKGITKWKASGFYICSNVYTKRLSAFKQMTRNKEKMKTLFMENVISIF